MASYTIADIPRISAQRLHSMLVKSLASQPDQPEASKGTAAASTTTDEQSSADDIPSIAVVDVRDSDYIGGHIRDGQNVPLNSMDYRAPELVRNLKDKDMVVFHCMLSQQRGPSGALKYLRERERMGVKNDQKVVVLDGGFQAWQAKYGLDETVTEGYRKELWDDY